MINKPFRIEAVLFDFDGTLTKPGALDFPLLKETIGCPPDSLVLEFIESLPSADLKAETRSVLENFERTAAENSEANLGAEDLLQYLHSQGLAVGIISRNSFDSIELALQNFKNINISDFNLIITRDTPVKPKPSPDGILMAAQELNVDVQQLLMVGDFIFDIQAGQYAGSMTVFIDNGQPPGPHKIESDFRISRLEELKKIIRMGTPLPMGKLPNDILEEFIRRFDFQDPSVLINPGVGEDTAAVNVAETEVLVLKSDPITFVTDSIGHYAVLINANDIATSGAMPRWFLTTLLFPCNTTASEIWQVMHDLESTCRNWNITLCGGHTEITDAVTRPVVTGMLAGTVAKRDLIDKSNMKPGDKVLMTKAVAVEGTAIIAAEFEGRLKELGLSETVIKQGKEFLVDISILTEAEIAANSVGVSAMHDVTEGGLATALEELSIAGGHRIRIHMGAIPCFSQTQEISRLLDIDPLGLIGSGSLLICCRADAYEGLMTRIQNVGIRVTCIGEVLEAGRGIEAVKDDGPAKWPIFEVDELARLF